MQPANMTGLAQPPPAGRLRHQDPPRLWRNIVAGSVGMHLLLLLALPSLLQPVDSQSQAGMQAPTPIELIDLAQVGVNSQTAAGEGAAAIDAPNPDAPNPDAPNPDAPNPETPAANLPATAQSTQTAPPSAVAPTALAGDRPAPPAPAPNPLPPPSPVPPPDTANPENPGLPLRVVGTPLPNAPNLNPGDVAREGSSPGEGLAGAGNPDASGSTPGAGLSEISINSQPSPTSLNVSVVSISQLPPNETADTPDQSAVLLNNSFTVIADPTQPGACELTPESVNFFGATVAMQVTVELDGRVSKTQIRQSSGSTEYDNLASCLVEQNLRFTPASTDGIETPSDNLVVSITVVGSNLNP